MRELYAFIADHNIKAVDVVEKLVPLLNGTDYAGHLDSVNRAVEIFDSDKASEALKTLLRALDIS